MSCIHRVVFHVALVGVIVAPGSGWAAELLFETASGTPQTSGVLFDDQSWIMHRFEMTAEKQLRTVGGSFQNLNSTGWTVFAAVVDLPGASGLPFTNDLMGGDVLGTTVITVLPTGIQGGDYSADIELDLDAGWYGLVFGTGDFGALSGPPIDLSLNAYSNDLAPTQNPVSMFQPDHPTLPNLVVNQLSKLRFFATAADPSEHLTTLGPAVDALASLSGAAYGVTDGQSNINAQYIPIAGVDRRGILEFDISEIPAGSTILSASLELNVNVLTHSGGDYPTPLIFGYAGDGLATAADAVETGNLLLETDPITSTGIKTFELDPAFFESLLGTTDFAGLLIRGDEDGHQTGFATSETINFSPPSLTFAYTVPVIAGDYNGDGKVSAADYTVWRDTHGSTTDLRANGDNTGASENKIDDADYEFWIAQYGGSGQGSGNAIAEYAPVPEPSAMMLLAIGAMAMSAVCSTRQDL